MWIGIYFVAKNQSHRYVTKLLHIDKLLTFPKKFYLQLSLKNRNNTYKILVIRARIARDIEIEIEI